MKDRMIPAGLFAIAIAWWGCNGSTSPSSTGPGSTGASGDQRFNPPSTEFAAKLGIQAPPPVTADQAKQIAAEAAGGTAVSVAQESDGGELLYEVQVRTSSGNKEVEVRASDGGVAEIESADKD
jgi:hypothetical protein